MLLHGAFIFSQLFLIKEAFMKLLELIGNLGKGVIKTVKDNDTLILTGGIIVGVGSTAYLTHKATVKAYGVIEKAEYTSDHPLTRKEKVGLVWKIYVPPFAAAVATISLAISNQIINKRKYASIVEAYLMAKTARDELEQKTEQVIGKNKLEKIKDDIVHDKIEMDPPNEDNVSLTTHGETLCYDEYHRRYFRHDIPKIKEGFNSLVERFNNSEIISYEDIFWDIYDIVPPKSAANLTWTPGFN
jgi:hypothetical protein